MKEHPILFSTPMVQAILEGRKTQTRRIVKTTGHGWDAQELEFDQIKYISAEMVEGKTESYQKEMIGTHAFFNATGALLGTRCHYGQPGDLLWVRETFTEWPKGKFQFKASTAPGDELGKWKPSIHMSKAAARIWLEITEVKVERVQDISEVDAKAEGIHIKYWGGDITQPYAYRPTAPSELQATDYDRKPEESFKKLWCSINGAWSWIANPWVWVLKFKVLSTTGKLQMCYKTNELCKYDCKGLCRESM